jgi:hypothetical protein
MEWFEKSTSKEFLFLVEQQTQRLLTLIGAKRPQRNLSTENGSGELMKSSAEGNDGRSQSHIPVIPHPNSFTSVFFPAVRACEAVSAGANDSKVKHEPIVKKLTTKSRKYPQHTMRAPQLLCRYPGRFHVRPGCAI